jgi:hypothetical protein
MIKLRDYQIEISQKAVGILHKLKIVYLAMEVRTGKTLTALNTAELYNAKKVLFLTKKKAIQSILNDYNSFNFNYELVVINNESLHLIKDNDFDLIISDEHHRNGAFPKPNKVTKLIKERFSKLPMIFLSGTPTPESYSQWYHQFWISNYSPFKEYVNFYKFANAGYIDVKLKYVGYANVKDYTTFSEKGLKYLEEIKSKYVISFTQQESGFNSKVTENIINVKMNDITYLIAKTLKKDNIFKGKNDLIIADTGVKLMSKLHQLYSGTCILESGKSIILDNSKCKEIENKFNNNKIAIFYKFQAEYDLIKQYFCNKITNDLNDFNTTDKWIALQIVSGREGISLKEADYLVYFNIDYSAVSYWQSRDRLTTIDRKENNVYWLFSENGIEKQIYKAVQNKKNFTLSIFKKENNGFQIPK